MDWLALVLALVKLLGGFTQWLHDKAMIDAGQAKTVANELQAQNDALRKAIAAREAVRADAARHPERVPDDDGFKRD